MEIRIILQQQYGVHTSGKELLLLPRKYKEMVKEGVKMRVMAPERLKAGTSTREYVFVEPEKEDTKTKNEEE